MAIHFPSLCLTLLIIYRHHKKIDNFLLSLDNILGSKFFHQNNNAIVLLGDINIDTLKKTSTSKRYLSVVNSYNFRQLVNFPTRENACLDHIFTKKNSINNVKVRKLNFKVSDHIPLSIKISNNKDECPLSKYTRIYSNKNITNFIKDFVAIDWNLLVNANNNININIDTFLTQIDKIANKNFARKVVEKQKASPWLNQSLKLAINRKNALLKKQKRKGSLSLSDKFRLINTKLKYNIKKAKRNFFLGVFSTNNSKKKWQCLSTLLGRKHNINSVKPLPTCESLSEHYASIFSYSENNPNNPSSKLIQQSIFLSPCKINEILLCFQKLPNKRTCQANDIPMFVWKMLAPFASSILTFLCNQMIESEIFPDRLKLADIIPILKPNKNNLPCNYRPVTILHNLSKIFERVLLHRLSSFIDKIKIMPNFQYGFRNKCSTKDAICNLFLNIDKNKLRRKKTCALFIDLTGAFDSVNHQKLLEILCNIGIRGKALNILHSFLHNRHFRVKANDEFGPYKTILRGVPQGSLLSPLLYNIYVHNINIPLCDVIQYADDTTICIDYTSITELKNKINDVCESLENYLNPLCLRINASKTNIVLFNDKEVYEFRIFDSVISNVPTTKFLGVTINQDCKFDSHAVYVCKKIKSTLTHAYNISTLLNTATKKVFIYSFVLCHIIYACPFLLFISSQSLSLLNKAYKKVVKVLFRLSIRTPSNEVFQKTNLMPLSDVINFHSLIYCYKIYTNNIPESIRTYFNISRSNNFLLDAHTHTTLHNLMCIKWNSLPNVVKLEPTMYRFKNHFSQ